jgi:P27 family predicted phage terminase small subunit
LKQSGPPKKPTKLKLLQGTFRKDRAPGNEPKPEPAIPPVPEQLSPQAKVEWTRISKELSTLGLLTRIDRAALAAYCEAWSDWLDASQRCRTKAGKDLKVIKTGERVKYGADGKVIERSGGNFIENPYYSIKKRSAELMHKFLTEFGMTPAARSRINAKPVEAAKPSAWKGFVAK